MKFSTHHTPALVPHRHRDENLDGKLKRDELTLRLLDLHQCEAHIVLST